MKKEIEQKDISKVPIINRQIDLLEEELFMTEIEERFLQRKVLGNTSVKEYEMALGRKQAEVNAKKEYIEFLKEILKEYTYDLQTL